ncbi:unnamed protein product [Spirodela intermedia]|uniref:Uncharacterized protein n=2 Tax=Spirodela intermedia TaxID=51605 RepID=A0A7I8I9T4_SPIIN|nr:unnamed protein product [Spirodela intermedia]CAA6654476.1 unnamed protein product [Spirodela intermedia]CAA7389075.1 unnamed protein product [Spirodela intermedia]
MEGGAADLHLHLLKVPATVTEENLAHVLETLWSTRNTGVSSVQKRDLQSHLGLASTGELEPVLACLRSIIRKSGRQNLSMDDIQRLFPHDLPVVLQSSLLVLFQRYQSEWKEEASRDQGNLPCLKSMTWTIENRHSGPSDRVAVICLKLQDYTKSPSGEVEVKFQLSRDTLEAMLRSMTYISDQLSSSVRASHSSLFLSSSFYLL